LAFGLAFGLATGFTLDFKVFAGAFFKGVGAVFLMGFTTFFLTGGADFLAISVSESGFLVVGRGT